MFLSYIPQLCNLIVFCILALRLDLHTLADERVTIGVVAPAHPVKPVAEGF